MDTYSMNKGMSIPGVVTGKPVHLGGSLGRVKATGRGVFVLGCEAMRRLNMPLDDARVAVQGFGNVGSTVAELFANAGAKVVAVQDSRGATFNAHGLKVAALAEHVTGHHGVADFSGGEKLEREDFWDVGCEVMIPAALEGQIDEVRARRIKARLVLEGANGPTLPQADDILASRGVTVLPDVLCNAGGVTVSYFEWVQDFASYYWTEDEINQRLDKIVLDALTTIWETSQRLGISLRTAAFVVGCERILTTHVERGLYP
jgi:glutamate dehydrogenase (NAD(P)+)